VKHAGGPGKEDAGAQGRYDDQEKGESPEANALSLRLVRQGAERQWGLGQVGVEYKGNAARPGDAWHLPGLRPQTARRRDPGQDGEKSGLTVGPAFVVINDDGRAEKVRHDYYRSRDRHGTMSVVAYL